MRSVSAHLLTCLALAFGSVGSALANDSTAELGAGGLQLVYNPSIQLLSEDLFVSVAEVRVTYHFRNTGDAPVTALVAFPLPAIDGINPDDEAVVLPDPGNANFVDFAVTVDGKPVTPALYQRVTALGIDRTSELTDRQLPLNPLVDGIADTLRALPADQLDRLGRLGMVEIDPDYVLPNWRYEAIFTWEQTFPPGQDVVVEHTYKPVAAFGLFGEGSVDEQWYKDNDCLDAAIASAATKLLKKVADSDYPYLDEERISYILTTATNWSGPIGRFTLTVDKGAPDALVSFCAKGVRKTGPTTYEFTAKDYVPDKELQVLILKRHAP